MIKQAHFCWECKAREGGFGTALKMFKTMYQKKKLSTYQIGELFDCSWFTIDKWLKFYKIPLRKVGGDTRSKEFKRRRGER